MDIFIQISRERLQIFWIMKMEMLLPDWEKKSQPGGPIFYSR